MQIWSCQNVFCNFSHVRNGLGYAVWVCVLSFQFLVFCWPQLHSAVRLSFVWMEFFGIQPRLILETLNGKLARINQRCFDEGIFLEIYRDHRALRLLFWDSRQLIPFACVFVSNSGSFWMLLQFCIVPGILLDALNSSLLYFCDAFVVGSLGILGGFYCDSFQGSLLFFYSEYCLPFPPPPPSRPFFFLLLVKIESDCLPAVCFTNQAFNRSERHSTVSVWNFSSFFLFLYCLVSLSLSLSLSLLLSFVPFPPIFVRISWHFQRKCLILYFAIAFCGMF